MSTLAAADGKRLASLFQASSAQPVQGNDALRFKSPVEPSRASQSQPQPAPQPQVSNAVVFHTTVSLYKFDAAARKYVQMGSSTSTVVGCVLVGAEVTYSILLYGSDKVPIAEVPLPAWKPTVQPKHYLNFYDDKGTNWSAKFGSDAALAEFMRHVFLVRIHVEIWSPTRSLDTNALLTEDLGAAGIKGATGGEDAASPVVTGDRVAVEFKCWRVVGNAKATPSDVVTKYPPFEKSNDGEQRKFRVGSGSERIKALEEGVVGMKRGAKRMILAPPGKTNGQEWYLLEATLVKKSSKKEGTERRASEMPAQSVPQDPEPRRRKESRRKTPPPAVNEDGVASNGNSGAARGDIVRYEDDTAKDDLAARIRELEKQLNDHNKPQANEFNGMPAAAQQQQQQYASVYPGATGGAYTPFGGMFASNPMAPTMPQGMMTTTGRPLDGLVMELHAKVDYLIRMAPTGGASGSGMPLFGGVVGATDVQSVLRGVERLAGENERLLLQINSQNQQYASYEKRCEELLKQNQRLQDEKRVADEKYQSIASLQMNYNAEISSLTSARDAAITHANRLHNEYQQLYAAFNQKQQMSSENEEQRNALEFERQARVRIEKELQTEAQTKSLIEQELTLVKKQLEVVTKMKESELQSRRQEMEKQYQAAMAAQQQVMDERVKTTTLELQQREKQMQQEWAAQVDAHKAQNDSLQLQVATLKKEHASVSQELEIARVRVSGLVASPSSGVSLGLADEEKHIYTEQIELLHQQIKNLEADKFARMQQALEGADDSDRATLAEAVAKEEEARRTLAMAEEVKREAQTMMQSGGNGGGGGGGQDARQETIALFKEAVNEMFFRFQDVFEDAANAATPLESKQVLSVIRKVLKQSTKDVLGRLQQDEIPAPVTASSDEGASPTVASTTAVAVTAAAVTAAAATVVAMEIEQAAEPVEQEEEEEGEEEEVEEDRASDRGRDSGESNDEPPLPPDVAAADQSKPVEANATQKTEDVKEEEEEDRRREPETDGGDDAGGEKEEEDDGGLGDDLLFGAASVSSSMMASSMPRRKESTDVSEDEDEDFDD